MRKTLAVLILVAGLSMGGKVILAQSPDVSSTPTDGFDYQRAYQDYSYNLSLYNSAYDEYSFARSQYIQFKTITSQENAQKAVFKMLKGRDDAVRTYLTSIRMKIRETEGVADTEKESSYNLIDNEINYYQDHKDKLPSAGSLDDYVADSGKASDRYEKSTKIVIYKTLISIAIGKNTNLRSRIEKNIVDLKSKIAEIRLTGDKDVSVMERSIIDMENRLSRSREKETIARNTINSIKSSEKDKAKFFNTSLQNAQDSLSYIKEVNTYLLEIIRQIKSK